MTKIGTPLGAAAGAGHDQAECEHHEAGEQHPPVQRNDVEVGDRAGSRKRDELTATGSGTTASADSPAPGSPAEPLVSPSALAERAVAPCRTSRRGCRCRRRRVTAADVGPGAAGTAVPSSRPATSMSAVARPTLRMNVAGYPCTSNGTSISSVPPWATARPAEIGLRRRRRSDRDPAGGERFGDRRDDRGESGRLPEADDAVLGDADRHARRLRHPTRWRRASAPRTLPSTTVSFTSDVTCLMRTSVPSMRMSFTVVVATVSNAEPCTRVVSAVVFTEPTEKDGISPTVSTWLPTKAVAVAACSVAVVRNVKPPRPASGRSLLLVLGDLRVGGTRRRGVARHARRTRSAPTACSAARGRRLPGRGARPAPPTARRRSGTLM